jgi:hypothetical protein
MKGLMKLLVLRLIGGRLALALAAIGIAREWRRRSVTRRSQYPHSSTPGRPG